jgi:hypothetical protein
MKLFELGAPRKSTQNANLIESYFGKSINLDAMTKPQARKMLHRVRELVREHRGTREFHQSEKNPAYLQLVIMEQALAARVSEADISQGGQTAAATPDPAIAAKNKQQAMIAQQATLNKIKDPKLQQAMKKSMAGQNLNPAEQQLVSQAAMSGGGEETSAPASSRLGAHSLAIAHVHPFTLFTAMRCAGRVLLRYSRPSNVANGPQHGARCG